MGNGHGHEGGRADGSGVSEPFVFETVLRHVRSQATWTPSSPLGQVHHPIQKVTIYRNGPLCGYVICLTTTHLLERIVCPIRKPVALALDWFGTASALFTVLCGPVC
jgi:hypothetical protein